MRRFCSLSTAGIVLNLTSTAGFRFSGIFHGSPRPMLYITRGDKISLLLCVAEQAIKYTDHEPQTRPPSEGNFS